MSKAYPDILIVGAGPVGLAAAVELKRRGFRPRIVDAGPGPSAESRALGINPRTLDILEPSGATKRLIAQGLKMRRANFHTADRTLFRIDIGRLAHRYNFMLSLPQSDTERVLIELLGADSVEWNTRATALDLSDNKPAVTLEHAGARKTVSPDIAIGADGAQSIVRRSAGIGFAGSVYEHDWSLADFRMDGPYPREELHAFDLAPVLVALIPMPGGLTRAVCDQANVLEVLPRGVAAREVTWESRFRIAHRLVETYQRGPVFLAGDAAHIHSPVGGRGMNLGIEDAAWLAWLIERGETGRYTRLRQPIARRVLKMTDGATRLLASDGWLARTFRRRLLPRLTSTGFVQARALRRLAGLDTPPPDWL